MESKEIKIKRNESKIETLRIEYNDIMSRLSKIKDMKLFHLENNKALSISNKINDLRKKNKFLDEGAPSNGWADHHEDINIIE
jgi:hypothetical protein